MKMKRSEKRKLKLSVLSIIQSSKPILFGQCSSTLTKHRKKEEWEKICCFAKSIGALDANRDWAYLRDVWWPNAKKGTFEKIENSRKIDISCGKDYSLDEFDEMIVDITNCDSHVIDDDGLNVNESNILEPVSTFCEITENSEYEDFVTIEESNAIEPEEEQQPSPHKERHISKLKTKEFTKQHETKMELQIQLLRADLYQRQLECRKLELEVEEVKKQHGIKKELQNQLLKAELYHHQLQCRKLEIELGLQRSDITRDINETCDMKFES